MPTPDALPVFQMDCSFNLDALDSDSRLLTAEDGPFPPGWTTAIPTCDQGWQVLRETCLSSVVRDTGTLSIPFEEPDHHPRFAFPAEANPLNINCWVKGAGARDTKVTDVWIYLWTDSSNEGLPFSRYVWGRWGWFENGVFRLYSGQLRNELEPSAVEVDRIDKVLFIPEATGRVLHPLNL
jgi:hypothetical protein